MSWGDYPGEERETKGRPRRKSNPIGEIVAVYDYLREDQSLAFQVVRDDKKEFYPRRPNLHRDPQEPAWLYGLGNEPRILYNLPEVKKAILDGSCIFIVEGEKDANTLTELGFTATTNPGGVGMGWTELHVSQIAGAADVIILPDNDEPGATHARRIRKLLRTRVGRVRIINLSGLSIKGDVSDWFAAGHSLAEFEKAIENSTPQGWINAADLLSKDLPEVEWIVPNIMSKPSLTILSGESGVWKSWVGTQLCIAAATHAKWINQFEIFAERTMLVTADEDVAETRRKISYLTTGYGMNGTHIDLLGKNFLLWIGPLDFDDDAQFGNLEDAVGDFRPDLIVIDHVRVCMEGNENDSDFARKVKQRSLGIVIAHPCCVMWYHHWNKPSKDGGKRVRDRMRGTGALHGICDHHLAIERSPDGIGTFHIDKNRKGREPAPFNFIPRILETEGRASIEYSGDQGDRIGSTGCSKEILAILQTEPPRPWTRKEIKDRLEKFTDDQIKYGIRQLERGQLVSTSEGRGRTPSEVSLREQKEVP